MFGSAFTTSMGNFITNTACNLHNCAPYYNNVAWILHFNVGDSCSIGYFRNNAFLPVMNNDIRGPLDKYPTL